jgi:uncharacterized membrane protein YkvI
MNLHRAAAVLVPAAVFQSVIVGGAYGTGREIAEFISRFGPWGGVGVIALVALGFGLVLGVSFELARTTRTFDYRSFLKALLGPLWIVYEILFGILLLIVLAVTGAAAGTVLGDFFDVPDMLGTGLMLCAVIVLAWAGRRLVEITLTAGAVLLTAVICVFCWQVWQLRATEIAAAFREVAAPEGWVQSAFVFILYNSALAPVLLYVAAPLASRFEAFSAGIAAGIAGVLPALLFHIAFMGAWPEVTEQDIPTYWLMQQIGQPWLLTLYVCVLCMTIIQTGVGVLQGVNERLDNWWRERHGHGFSAVQHALAAGAAVLLSLLLAKLGIVKLVAQGYGTLAWGFLCIYTLPVLTLGLYRIFRKQEA